MSSVVAGTTRTVSIFVFPDYWYFLSSGFVNRASDLDCNPILRRRRQIRDSARLSEGAILYPHPQQGYNSYQLP
jgi:hypothetical protein